MCNCVAYNIMKKKQGSCRIEKRHRDADESRGKMLSCGWIGVTDEGVCTIMGHGVQTTWLAQVPKLGNIQIDACWSKDTYESLQTSDATSYDVRNPLTLKTNDWFTCVTSLAITLGGSPEGWLHSQSSAFP